MKIRINDKNAKPIAECTLMQDEYGNWLLINSDNCNGVFVDMEQDNHGFDDVVEIDIKELNK